MQVLYSPVSPFSTGEKTLLCLAPRLCQFFKLSLSFSLVHLSPTTRVRFRRRGKRKGKAGERGRKREKRVRDFHERDDLLWTRGREGIKIVLIYYSIFDSTRFWTKRIFSLLRHRYGLIEVRRDKVSIDESFRFLYEIAPGSRTVHSVLFDNIRCPPFLLSREKRWTVCSPRIHYESTISRKNARPTATVDTTSSSLSSDRNRGKQMNIEKRATNSRWLKRKDWNSHENSILYSKWYCSPGTHINYNYKPGSVLQHHRCRLIGVTGAKLLV